MPSKTVLLTGAAGRIGTALTLGLQDTYDLYLADIQPREAAAHKGPLYRSQRYVQVDLSQRQGVSALFRGLPPIDVLLHFSASWADTDQVLRDMICQTTYLTDAAVEHGVTQYIYASSCAAVQFWMVQAAREGNPFHLQERPPTIDETTPHRAPNHYGLAKVWMEVHARMLADVHGLRTIGPAHRQFHHYRGLWRSERHAKKARVPG